MLLFIVITFVVIIIVIDMVAHLCRMLPDPKHVGSVESPERQNFAFSPLLC